MGMRGASPAEKAEIRAKVHREFPGVGTGGGMKKTMAKKDERKGEKRMETGRKRESRGMKMQMGERGNHEATGKHEGRCMMGDCK
jgi:hypothetical protein